MLEQVFSFLVVIGIIIFIHESGHFSMAKLFRIPVATFSLGFGPKLFGFRRKETEYKVSIIPLGGYVKIHGMEDQEATPDDPNSFYNRPRYQRFLVLFMGVGFNMLLALLYVALGKLGLSLSMFQVTPVWPPSGLCLAAVLLLGSGVWPGIFAGAFLLNSLDFYNASAAAQSFLTSAGVSLGATLEAVAGGWLIRRFASGDGFLNRADDVFRFCYLGAFLGAAVSTIPGTFTLYAAGIIHRPDLRIIGLTWWMGDAVGILVVTPLIVAWVRERQAAWHISRAIEALCLGGLVFGVALLAFGALEFHIEYMLIPCLVWAAFRFHQKGATLVMALVSAVAIYGTVHGHGTFVMESVNDSLLLLQAFLGVTAITTLLLSAVLAERSRRTEELVGAMRETEKARKQAEEANLAKSAFLFNMNHELRTPLNHIIGYSDLLKEEVAEAGEPGLAPDIQKINEAGKHLLDLISQILDFSALETGHMQPSVGAFDVTEAAADAVSAIRPLVEKNGNTLSVRVSEDAGVMKSDRAMVQQILLRVLSNASRFTHNGEVIVDVRPAADQLVFSVRDNGIGMTEDQLAKLFRPFVQASAGAAKKYGGLGLGLAMSRMYSRLLGGDITAESRPGKGSTFTIRLPRNM